MRLAHAEHAFQSRRLHLPLVSLSHSACPPLLVMLLVGRRRNIMGEHTNCLGISLIIWVTVVIMSLAALGVPLTTS